MFRQIAASHLLDLYMQSQESEKMLSVMCPSGKVVKHRSGDLSYLLFFYIFAAVLLLFCTPNSPLFSTQSWVDPNVYMDVGRALNEGRVLYRDIFDHKGPLYLMIFAVLAPISKYTLTGLYLLQTVCLGTSLVFLFKTSRLCLSRTASLFICATFPYFLLAGSIYSDGGGSPEEILLPCLTGCLYFVLRALMPDKDGVSGIDALRPFWFHGLFLGIALLTKLNLVVFFAAGSGMLLLRFLLKRDTKNFSGAFFRIIGGMFLAFLPCIIYWTATGSLMDCFKVYVQFNLSYASSTVATDWFYPIMKALMIVFTRNFTGILCAALGLTILRMQKIITGYALCTISLMFLSLFVVTFGTGRIYWYYCIPFVCFAGLGEIGIAVFLREAYIKWLAERIEKPIITHHVLFHIIKAISLAALFAVIIYANGFWQLSSIFPQEKSGVEKTCDAILTSWAANGSREEPNLLLYHSPENGYYSELGTAPQYKYFYRPGISLDAMPFFLTAQDSYVTNSLPDYIICASDNRDADFGISKLNGRYKKIGIYEKNTKKPYSDSGVSYLILYQKG